MADIVWGRVLRVWSSLCHSGRTLRNRPVLRDRGCLLFPSQLFAQRFPPRTDLLHFARTKPSYAWILVRSVPRRPASLAPRHWQASTPHQDQNIRGSEESCTKGIGQSCMERRSRFYLKHQAADETPCSCSQSHKAGLSITTQNTIGIQVALEIKELCQT